MTDNEHRLEVENDTLRHRLEEAEETIRAIQSGAVDALVVGDGSTHRIYTLEGADRLYRLWVEQMQQGAATLQEDGAISYANRQLAEILGVAHGKLTGLALEEFVARGERSAFSAMMRDCGANPGAAEYTVLRADGEKIPVYVTCSSLSENGGAKVGVLITDLTSQKHHEHLKILVDELNHRVKNTLSSVQSIAQQTLRRTESPEQFVNKFNGRITALARVHSMLSAMTWQGADLRALIEDQVLLGSIEDRRLIATGPSVMVDSHLASHLAMVVHELGINSLKYGALSVADGSVNVGWQYEGDTVRLNWTEHGGPRVEAPARRGFGSTFIEQTMKSYDGFAEVQFEPEGIVWKLTLPLGRFAAHAPPILKHAQNEGR